MAERQKMNLVFQDRFIPKKAKDGRCLLNLACGSKTHWSWNNIDFSPYSRLSHHRQTARLLRACGILSEYRYETLLRVDPDIIAWDLRRGIPFEEGVFDAVYSSHFIEHVDRDAVPGVFQECHRVLKPHGVLRIAVPDLLSIVEDYSRSARLLENGDRSQMGTHKEAVNQLFEQMVRLKAVGGSRQVRLVRCLEYLLRGDVRKRGELHRWMYDKYTLGELLGDCGFAEVGSTTAHESGIAGWSCFHLDTNEDNTVYMAGSLYMEGVKS
jgi:SAM-dependent methyltransferase